jgi:hypothetical protein
MSRFRTMVRCEHCGSVVLGVPIGPATYGTLVKYTPDLHHCKLVHMTSFGPSPDFYCTECDIFDITPHDHQKTGER